VYDSPPSDLTVRNGRSCFTAYDASSGGELRANDDTDWAKPKRATVVLPAAPVIISSHHDLVLDFGRCRLESSHATSITTHGVGISRF
jgi:hypothetical protein